MSDVGQPGHAEGQLVEGRPALPVETRVLLDVWLALGIVVMLIGGYLGYSTLNALDNARSQFNQPGPAPTATSACIEGRDILTGEPC